MQPLMQMILQALFDYPVDLRVEESEGTSRFVLEIEAPPEGEPKIIRELFGESAEYTLEEREGKRFLVVELDAAPSPPPYLGPCPGGSGRIGRALRTLVRAAGTGEHKSLWVHILRRPDGPRDG